jgi:hypothetical protein
MIISLLYPKMQKKKKTRKDKVRSQARRRQNELFQVSPEWLKTGTKSTVTANNLDESGLKYLRLDLTKTFLLSMLVLALELGLWQYLSRR